ncbi:MAG: hypothetical protein HQL52_14395 [Magnetococcales bacterium]|nr:hypothetical protein [Magnetococcales bacterium]
MARARLEDSVVLLKAERFEGAVYLCGYALEMALKARICKTLSWQGFPSTPSEFNKYRSFKVHDLDVLLHLSGVEQMIKGKYNKQWSEVASWTPESRYAPSGNVSGEDAQRMIRSTRNLLEVL